MYQAALLEPQYLPNLAEVDLGWFQGLRNGELHSTTDRVAVNTQMKAQNSRLRVDCE